MNDKDLINGVFSNEFLPLVPSLKLSSDQFQSLPDIIKYLQLNEVPREFSSYWRTNPNQDFQQMILDFLNSHPLASDDSQNDQINEIQTTYLDLILKIENLKSQIVQLNDDQDAEYQQLEQNLRDFINLNIPVLLKINIKLISESIVENEGVQYHPVQVNPQQFFEQLFQENDQNLDFQKYIYDNNKSRKFGKNLEENEKNLFQILEGFGIGSIQNECNLELPIDNCFENLYLEIDWAQIKFQRSWIDFIFLEEIIINLYSLDQLSEENKLKIQSLFPSKISIGAIVIKNILIKGFSKKRAVEFLLKNLTQTDQSFFALNFEVSSSEEKQNNQNFEVQFGDEYQIKLKQPRLLGYIVRNLKYASDNQMEELSDSNKDIGETVQPIQEERTFSQRQIERITNQIEQLLKEQFEIQRIIDYFRQFRDIREISNWEDLIVQIINQKQIELEDTGENFQLPTIQNYEQKQILKKKLGENQVRENIPDQLLADYKGLSKENISVYLKYFQKHRCITNRLEQLFPQELQECIQILRNIKEQQPDFKKIQNETFVHFQILSGLYEKRFDEFINERTIINGFIKHDNIQSHIDIAQMLNDKSPKLIEKLIQIFKKNGRDYLNIIDACKKNTFAEFLLDNQIEIFLKALEANDKSKQLEMIRKLQNNDPVLCLKILNCMQYFKQQYSKKVQGIWYDKENYELIKVYGNIQRAITKCDILQMNLTTKNISINWFKQYEERRLFHNADQIIVQQFIDEFNQMNERERDIENGEKNYFKLLIKYKELKLQQSDFNFLKYYLEEEQILEMNSQQNNDQHLGRNDVEEISKKLDKQILLHQFQDISKIETYGERSDNQPIQLAFNEKDSLFYILIPDIIEFNTNNTDSSKLKKKFPEIFDNVAQWMAQFLGTKNLIDFVYNQQDDSQQYENIEILKELSQKYQKFQLNPTEQSFRMSLDFLKKLQIKNEDLFNEWFALTQSQTEQGVKFAEMYHFAKARTSLQHLNSIKENIKTFFPNSDKIFTLEDFNRICGKIDKNQQYERFKNIKNIPQSFIQEVIKQMFGYFNRRENLSSFLQDLKSLDLPIQISSRFLLNFVLQNSDIELRSRLIQYQSEYFSVPLIMQNQLSIQDQSKQSIVVPEIAFEMLDGSGILNLGVGLFSINPIGKTQILNDTLFPSHEINHEAFEQQDRNLYSYQQIDVFFEKSFEVKRNIILMDVQGTISESILKNILTLTNIAIIHFSSQDLKEQSQLNDLKHKISIIKSSIDCILILVIRDTQESKAIKIKQDQKFPEQYSQLQDVQSKIDYCFKIKNMTGQGKNDRILMLKDFQILCNTLIEKLKGDRNRHKFTKKNFLYKFLSSYEKDNENIQIVKDIVQQQESFIKMVDQIKGNIFDNNGLPILALKRNIRKIQIQIQQNQKSQNKNIDPDFEFKQESQKKVLEQQIQTINPSPILQLFYKIVMDQHSQLILREIEKYLKILTQEMIKQPRQEKINLIEEQKKQSEKKESSTREEIDQRLSEYKEKIENINEEIYKKSVSLEYFWRNLIFYLGKETKYIKWNNLIEKKKVLNKIENHLMKGDCFELIEGENLDFKGYFIKEVIGSSQNENVIVVCVIGPQSSGKSTLMNSALGCQFGTGSGRCTIGVYFTLQRFPDENKNGVKWLLMLDTEGLQSPERIDDEYDRKIVLFAMLSSDILIINNKGEINANMINTLKMCTLTFDQIKKPGYNPEIYYIFGQNDDQNMQPFVKQVLDLKSDLVESCDSETINKTSEEILGYRDDKINVLGFAYKNEAIEKDDNKGLKYDNSFKISITNFGVETSKIYQIILKYVNDPNKRFNQISSWIENQKNSWETIDKFSDSICAFSNLEEYKNDKKVKKFLDQKWLDYFVTQKIEENDKKKSEQIRKKLIELLKNEGEQAMQKEIENAELEYNKEKDMDFQNYIISSFDDWKQLSDQKGVTIQSEKKHKSEIQSKIDFLKNKFIVKLKSNMKEELVKYLREKGNKQIKELALSILKDENIMSLNQKEKEIIITKKFDEQWQKQQDEFKAQDQFDSMKNSYFNSIQISFKNINNFIEIYGDVQYKELQKKIDLALQKNSQNGLISLIVDELTNPQWHLHNEGMHKRIFNSDEQLILQNKNNLGALINNIEGQEVYLKISKYFKSIYLFKYSLDPNVDLFKKELENDMKINLNIKKQQESNQINSAKNKFNQNQMETVNDFESQIKYLQILLQDFEQAGFVIQVKKSAMFGLSSKTEDQKLSQLNVQEIIQSFGTDKNRAKKIQEWISNVFIQQLKFNSAIKNKIEVSQRIEKYFNFKQQSINIENNKSINDNVNSNSDLQKAVIVQKPEKRLQINSQIEDKELKDSIQSIINMQFKDNSFLQIQNTLFYVAYKSLDFNMIAQTIINSVQQILKQNQGQIEKENAGIVKILEANQITAQQMQDLEKNHLELKIKIQIQNELKSKLGIELNHQMNGKITQCAMIVCWAELSKKAQDYQDQQLIQFQKYKIDNFNIFKDSILGNNDIATQKNTEKLITKAFLDYFQKQQLQQQAQASLYLNSLKEEFQTLKVYDYLDNFYFSLRGQADDEEIIEYIQDPVSIFIKKIEEMKKQKIEYKYKTQSHEIEHKTLENIQVLIKIVMILNNALESNQIDWEQITLEDYFNVYDSSGQLVSYQQKYDLKDQIHPLIIQLLKKIISGDFSMKDQFNLQVNRQTFKFVPQDKKDNGPLFIFSDENLKKQIKQQFEKNQFTEFASQLYQNLETQSKDIQIFKIDIILKQMKVKLQSLYDQMETSQTEEVDQIQSSLIGNNEINLDRKKQDSAIYQVNLSQFEDLIDDLQTQALGCKATCKFCSRKCELQVHNSSKKHSCNTMGHQLRVFGQGHFTQDDDTKLPALLSCQNIIPNQQVQINQEISQWKEVQTNFQDDWDIQLLQGEQELKKRIEIFSNFWTHFGQNYCKKINYKFVERQSTEQIEKKLYILAIKESSGSMGGSKWKNANTATQEFIDHILQTKQNLDSVHFMLIHFNQHYKLVLDQDLSETLPEWKKNQPDGAGIDFGLLFSKLTEKLSQTIADFHSVQVFIYTDNSSHFPRDAMINLQTLMENKRKDFKHQNKNKLKFVLMHSEKDQEVPNVSQDKDGKEIKTKKSYYNIYEHLNKNSKDLFGHENTVLIQSVQTIEIFNRIKENFEVKQQKKPMIETFNF